MYCLRSPNGLAFSGRLECITLMDRKAFLLRLHAKNAPIQPLRWNAVLGGFGALPLIITYQWSKLSNSTARLRTANRLEEIQGLAGHALGCITKQVHNRCRDRFCWLHWWQLILRHQCPHQSPLARCID